MIIHNPGQPANPPIGNPTGGGSGGTNAGKLIGTNPGRITSTGGLLGSSGLLMAPAVNNVGNANVIIFDSTNFNCEEDCEYDYPQGIPQVQGNPYQEGCKLSITLIKLKYYELGVVKFTINVRMYDRDLDVFTDNNIVVNINNPKKRKSFPDGLLHTMFIGANQSISGERPQPIITRKANAGPLAITKLILCGTADETPQL